MDHSAILIIPTALKPAADAIGAAMGWGDESYTITLSDDDGVTLTHYALRADCDHQFIRWVRGQESLPNPAMQPVIDALISDFSPDPDAAEKPVLWGRDHLDAVLTEVGFVRLL